MSKNSTNDLEGTKKSNGEQGLISSTISLIFIILVVFAFKSSILDANNIPSGSMLPTLKIGDFLFVNKMRYSFRMPFSESELFRYDNPKRGDIITFIPPDHAIQEDIQYDSETGLIARKPNQIPIIGNIFAKRFVKRVIGMPGDEVRITQKKMKTDQGDYVNYTYIEYKELGSNEYKTYGPTPVPNGRELKDLDNTRAIGRALYVETKRDFNHFVLEGYHDSASAYGYIRRNCPDAVCVIPEGYYMVMGDNRDDSSDSRFWGLVKREDILGKAFIIYFSINWKDYTCMYRDIPEDNQEDSYQELRYSNEEILKYCDNSDLDGNFSHETIMEWLVRTVRYRIFRMDVRWTRIGRILQ